MEQMKEGYKDLFYAFSEILETRLFLPASLFPIAQSSFWMKLNHLFPPFLLLPFSNKGQISIWWMYMERKIHLPSKTGIASQNPNASGSKIAQQGVYAGSSLQNSYQAGHAVTGNMAAHYIMRKSCHSVICSFAMILYF